MDRKYILIAGATISAVGAVSLYLYGKYKGKSVEYVSAKDKYETAYSYEEAVQKAREKVKNGQKDVKVRLVPTLEKPALDLTPVKESDMVNYSKIASEYSTEEDPDGNLSDNWWEDAFDKDEDILPIEEQPEVETAVEAPNVWIPMRDDDIGSYFRISEDKYKHYNMDFAKENGIFNAENKALMLANEGILDSSTELFRRVATIVFEDDEEDFADALYFENPVKKLDVKITVQM